MQRTKLMPKMTLEVGGEFEGTESWHSLAKDQTSKTLWTY